MKRPTRLCIETLDDRCLPSFSPAVSYPVDPSSDVVTADFNGDGHLDLATASSRYDPATDFYEGIVNVLLGNGDGTFQSPVTTAANDLQSFAVGDFNADGKLDLAVVHYADYASSGLSVMLGNGDGSFQTPAGVGGGGGGKARSVAVGDFNSDGKMDLAFTWDVDPYYPGDVYTDYGLCSVFLGNGDGSFQAPITPYRSLYPVGAVAVADLNGDAAQDLLVGTSTGSYGIVEVLQGDGQGNFTRLSGGRLDHGSSMTTGDLDGDGDADLVTATGSEVRVLLGNGTGGFETSDGGESYAAGLYPRDVVLGDFNGDGVLDIATNGGIDGVSVLRGRGDGTFMSPEHSPTGSYAYAVAAGDFNRDGWLDLTAANWGANTVSVLLNDQSWSGVGPTVSVGDTTVTEGNTGTVTAAFTVTLSAAYGQSVTVNYSTANGTATAGSDFQTASGTLTFAPGETSKTINVAVMGDQMYEPNETFAVNLSGATNATIGDGNGIGTIVNDDTYVTPSISIGDVSKVEGRSGTTLFTFTVTLSVPFATAVTVNYSTANGTATALEDYTAASGTLTFAPGETTKTITINVKGDRKQEANETFFVNLFGASSNAQILDAQGIGTILNDD